jgi:predicted RNase H-like HicB family nuclease
MKYAFPAVFVREESGFSVSFPDIESCYTCGETEQEALENAKDVLNLMLYELVEKNKPIATPTGLSRYQNTENRFYSLVEGDTDFYKRFYEKKSVKKTLSIPAWLNTLAEDSGINFSQVLQSALKNQLHIE